MQNLFNTMEIKIHKQKLTNSFLSMLNSRDRRQERLRKQVKIGNFSIPKRKVQSQASDSLYPLINFKYAQNLLFQSNYQLNKISLQKQNQMGIRFNRIESVQGSGNILDVEKNGNAIVVGRQDKPRILNLFRFDKNQISNHSFSVEPRITLDQKFVTLHKHQNDFVLYGSNQEGNIVKLRLNPQNDHTIEEYFSETVIKEIQHHPSQDSLAILNGEGIHLIQQNYTLLNLENQTIKDSNMIIERIDGVNNFFVGILTGEIGEKCFLQIHKTEQSTFASSYTSSVLSSNVLGVWKESQTFRIEKSLYFEKNKLIAFTVREYIPPEDINGEYSSTYHTYFFDHTLNSVILPEEIVISSSYMLSKTQNKLVNKQSNSFCAYNYTYEGINTKAINFDDDTRWCIDSNGHEWKQELASIQGTEYPVSFNSFSQRDFIVYDWNLTNIVIEYGNYDMVSFSTLKPDALIETTSYYQDSQLKYQVNEYDIVPISVGGIVGLVFGCIIGFILLVCFFCCCCENIVDCCRQCCKQKEKKVSDSEEQIKKKNKDILT